MLFSSTWQKSEKQSRSRQSARDTNRDAQSSQNQFTRLELKATGETRERTLHPPSLSLQTPPISSYLWPLNSNRWHNVITNNRTYSQNNLSPGISVKKVRILQNQTQMFEPAHKCTNLRRFSFNCDAGSAYFTRDGNGTIDTEARVTLKRMRRVFFFWLWSCSKTKW